ncbi:hypothetical protein JAAARDRAFT_35205 [Jaapia argillacea MUCL 33604]|uniref:DUF3224 domain-containing protein n=1 Tax=Jaapia argillacea MUCL 33604 TaxID=933084 RepID=A0A067Q1Z0_9AGAM|nr:hypothetical protein JAAARDRAFT_35205 [Jaapia argillacea MUCL 33604]
MPSIYTSTVMNKWDEDQTIEDTPRVTPAHAIFDLPEVKGKTATELIMSHLPDGNAAYVYAETITAEDFDGKKGSFIVQGSGIWDGKEHKATGTFEVVEGSGTGELKGIKGKGFSENTPKHGYRFEVTF